MRKILIVVDMQNDFIYGPLGTPEARAVVPKVQNLIYNHLSLGNDVVFTRDTHDSHYLNSQEGKFLPVEHCIEGTEGWQICNVLPTEKAYKTINKSTFGYLGWRSTDIDYTQYDEMVLCGLCSDICVVSNALILKALFPEKRISVVESCCAGTSPTNHNAAMTTMKMCQVEILK